MVPVIRSNILSSATTAKSTRRTLTPSHAVSLAHLGGSLPRNVKISRWASESNESVLIAQLYYYLLGVFAFSERGCWHSSRMDRRLVDCTMMRTSMMWCTWMKCYSLIKLSMKASYTTQTTRRGSLRIPLTTLSKDIRNSYRGSSHSHSYQQS